MLFLLFQRLDFLKIWRYILFFKRQKNSQIKNRQIYGNTILLYETRNKLTVIWKVHKEIPWKQKTCRKHE